MLNEKVKNIIRVFLPVLFITYACCITFFTHTHIVNGITIVHSHPYTTDDTGRPNHEHTGAELQLIHVLSSFFVAGAIVLTLFLGFFKKVQTIRYIELDLYIPSVNVEGLSRLRPPPAL